MSRFALELMSSSYEPALHVFQAEFAKPKSALGDVLVFFGVWRRVPSVDIVDAESDRLDLLRRRGDSLRVMVIRGGDWRRGRVSLGH